MRAAMLAVLGSRYLFPQEILIDTLSLALLLRRVPRKENIPSLFWLNKSVRSLFTTNSMMVLYPRIPTLYIAHWYPPMMMAANTEYGSLLHFNIRNRVTNGGNSPKVIKKFQCTPYSVTCSYNHLHNSGTLYLILHLLGQNHSYNPQEKDQGTRSKGTPKLFQNRRLLLPRRNKTT